THRDEFWHRKYAEDETGAPVAVPAGASADHPGDEVAEEHIHMPDPSYWPVVMTAGMLPLGYGLLAHASVGGKIAIAAGVLWMICGFFGWIIEPLAEGDDDPEPLAAH
ncbi:MAG: hypothetical protein WEB03_06840, partial [Nitriliruptor sp.]